MTVIDIQDRIGRSRSEFETFVWPSIRNSFPEGALIAVEGEAGEACKLLDFAGIDHFFQPRHGEAYGVSQRVLTGSWETLTMRPAELQRLQKVWGCPGAIAPALLIQGYVNLKADGNKHLDSAIVLRTAELLDYVLDHPGQLRSNVGGTAFSFWLYDDLEKAGVCAFRIPSSILRDPLGLSAKAAHH
jgi:hypothetical protein